jgi:hypothetical protein
MVAGALALIRKTRTAPSLERRRRRLRDAVPELGVVAEEQHPRDSRLPRQDGIQRTLTAYQVVEKEPEDGAPIVSAKVGHQQCPVNLGGTGWKANGDGWGRFNVYDELLTQADIVLVVGSRIDIVSDVNLGARFPKRMLQVDLDPLVVGQRRPRSASSATRRRQ